MLKELNLIRIKGIQNGHKTDDRIFIRILI